MVERASIKCIHIYMDLEDQNEKWQSCCFNRTTDSHLMKYMTQLTVSIAILTFSMTQIIRDVPSKEVYFSMISCIIGIYIPAPSHKRET